MPRGVPGAPITALRQVTARSPDYTRLYEATELAGLVVARRPGLAEVEARLPALARGGHLHPR